LSETTTTATTTTNEEEERRRRKTICFRLLVSFCFCFCSRRPPLLPDWLTEQP
jgi:hypothetical protein